MVKEKGIKGGLLFYAILSYLGLAFLLFMSIMSLIALKSYLGFIIYLGISIFYIYYLYLMHKHKKIFIKVTIILLYIGIALIIIGGILNLIVYFKNKNYDELLRNIFGFIISFFVTIAWLDYFKKSERVKNTFTK